MSRSRKEKRPGDLILPKPPPVPGQRQLADGPWGALWIATLENPRSGDTGQHEARLNRARTYARRGAVGAITVRKGELAARVAGSDPRPYKVTVRVPELPKAEGDRLLEAWADDSEALAELSCGMLGETTARLALAEGVALVPKPGVTEYECTCPDWGYPCKHAAALSYQFARTIDTRPDALLLLRGYHLNEVCDEAAIRRAEREITVGEQVAKEMELAAARAVPAGEAFARFRRQGRLPPLPPLPAPSAGPAPTGPFPDAGHDDSLAAPERLRMLADDAAHRAADAYTNAVEAGEGAGERLWLDADPLLDTVRRAARADGDPHLLGRLLSSSDQSRAQLSRASLAWKHGGEPALAVLDGGGQVPPPAIEAAAREQLLTVPLSGRPGSRVLRRTGSRLQLMGEDVELRYGPDRLWYPFRKQSGAWWSAGPPSRNAAEAVQGVLQTS
ncbi:SWIM zinc finger family protein [Streptomyces griseoluteus]|uniref:SWIM zinc finger family protein n=1 Tax=Streptomyces griseoluteus TaxID=29306 RepID=UPI0036883D0F